MKRGTSKESSFKLSEESSGSSLKTHLGISRYERVEENVHFGGIKSVYAASPKITVIIPALNEEKNIVEIIQELYRAGFSDILVIDGNSKDGTVDVAEKLGVKVVQQKGKGKGNALRQAFNYDNLGDWVVMIDADGSMNPEEIVTMLKPLGNGADVVKGSRFMPNGFSEDMTFLRRMGNSFFVLLVNLIWGARYTDLCYGYAAFSKKALAVLYPHLKSMSFEIETEIFVKARKLGLRVKEVPSIELPRKFGKSNLNSFKDGFQILKTILLEAAYS